LPTDAGACVLGFNGLQEGGGQVRAVARVAPRVMTVLGSSMSLRTIWIGRGVVVTTTWGR
jgi:hypothetical protein